MSRLYLSNPCAFFPYLQHTAMRAQSAPGFPCALSKGRGTTRCKTRAKASRGNESTCAQQTQCRPGGTPGPITTGCSYAKAGGSSLLQQHDPVVMGPVLTRPGSPGRQRSEQLHLFHSAPFRDEQRGRFRRFPQRLQVDKLV